jgi:hypothetical protein
MRLHEDAFWGVSHAPKERFDRLAQFAGEHLKLVRRSIEAGQYRLDVEAGDPASPGDVDPAGLYFD